MIGIEEKRNQLDKTIEQYGLLSVEVAVVVDELHKLINEEMKKQVKK